MVFDPKKIIHEQSWCFQKKEDAINAELQTTITDQEFIADEYPYRYRRGNQILSCRLVDSVFLHDPDAWTESNLVITDNIPLKPIQGKFVTVLPEYWHISSYTPVYENHQPTWPYNCFMNRISGDRSQVFYELIRRNLLNKGLVSFNCLLNGYLGEDSREKRQANYEWQYISADLQCYQQEHNQGRNLVPYNNILEYNGLESVIIDSKVTVILETYTSEDHIAFSEKIFRSLQMPRPWLLSCSPYAVAHLKLYGFDVLDDIVDHSYDSILSYNDRLQALLNQLEIQISNEYTTVDYARFEQAAIHNQKLLQQFELAWPNKFQQIVKEIQEL
jgi:hypothetical protein